MIPAPIHSRASEAVPTATRALAWLVLLASCVQTAEAQTPPRPAEARELRFVVNANPQGRASSCVARRGCAAPRAVPRCVDAMGRQRPAAVGVDRLWPRRMALLGRRVSVRGELVVAPVCTLLACDGGRCCNQCSGELTLLAMGYAVGLGADNDTSFVCGGDESGLCCSTEAPEGRVVVRGRLQRSRESERIYIEAPELCRE